MNIDWTTVLIAMLPGLALWFLNYLRNKEKENLNLVEQGVKIADLSQEVYEDVIARLKDQRDSDKEAIDDMARKIDDLEIKANALESGVINRDVQIADLSHKVEQLEIENRALKIYIRELHKAMEKAKVPLPNLPDLNMKL